MDEENRIREIKDTKELLIAQCKRVTELLETNEKDLSPSCRYPDKRPELKRKMHEVRRDMIRLEKLMYKYE